MTETRAVSGRPPQQQTGRDVVPADQQFGIVKQQLDAYAKSLVRVLPRHGNSDTFLGLAIAAVRRDPRLMEAAAANPQSFILALRQCAYLGHVPTRGLFALVAYRNNNAPGRWEVVGIEEVRGVVERMFRAGVGAVKVNTGRANDRVLRFNPTTMSLPEHEYDEFAGPSERGPLKVAYAWADMPNGRTSGVAWLPLHEIARRRAMSKSGEQFWGPEWPGEGPNTEPMWRKSALHALELIVPTSVEYRVQLDESTEAASSGQFAGMPEPSRPTDADWVDAEVIEG